MILKNAWTSFILIMLIAGCSRSDVDPKTAELQKQQRAREAADPTNQINGKSVEELVALLKNGSPEIQEEAARSLIELKVPQSVKSLIPLTKAQDPKVRELAVWVLSTIPDSLSFENVIELMQDEELNVRDTALAMLIKSKDPRAFESLQAALFDNRFDSHTRTDVVYWIAESSDPRASDTLLRALTEADEIGEGLIQSLGKRKEKRAVKPLIELLSKESDPSFGAVIAAALGEIGDSAAIEPLVKHAAVGTFYAEALTRLGWKPRTPDEEIRLMLAMNENEKLLQNWDHTLNLLKKDLDSSAPTVRINAVYFLLRFEKDEVIPILKGLLKSPDGEKVDQKILEVLLNCKHEELKSAAKNYAVLHGYEIQEHWQWR